MPNSKKAKEQRRSALAKARATNPKNQGSTYLEKIKTLIHVEGHFRTLAKWNR